MRTAICIASGTSLTAEDVDFCKGKGTVYVVKESALLAPWADVLYAADTDWFDVQERWNTFKGQVWTVSAEAAKKFGLHYIDYKPQEKWSFEPDWIATGGNSGFQALNLAVLQGAERVILLGYDMGHERGKNKHWYDDQIKRESRYSNYAEWIEKYNAAAPLIPVPVINCTRQTALTCFPRMTLQEALRD